MNMDQPNRYRHSRWPLAKTATSSVLWILFGSVLLFMVSGYSRLLGLAPLFYGVAQWIYAFDYFWKHVIIADDTQLKIGKHAYDWNQFDELRLDRSVSSRMIRLIGPEKKLDLQISDDLIDFDDFAHSCFMHLNHRLPEKAPLNIPPSKKPNVTKKLPRISAARQAKDF